VLLMLHMWLVVNGLILAHARAENGSGLKDGNESRRTYRDAAMSSGGRRA